MKKIKIIAGIFLVVIIAIITGILYRDNYSAVQTSLVKYLDGGKHQCVGYVQRYYQNMFGIKIGTMGVAMNMAERSTKYGLYFHKNGSEIIPQPGDIIVFGNRNEIGHVAIVTGTLKDGVLIVEQNWIPSKITTNHGKALQASYENGKYTIADRYYDEKKKKNKFWVMGWVSRHNKNPKRFFEFTAGDDNGWLPEHDVKYYKSDNEEMWSIKVIGRDPRILSPVFLEGIDTKIHNKIVFKAGVKNNEDATEGVIYLRDENSEWSEQIPFTVDYSKEDYQSFTVDLSGLRPGFKITQMKLKLANKNNSRGKEIWEIDWLRVGDRDKDILPIQEFKAPF